MGVNCSDAIGTNNYQCNMFDSFGGKNSNAVFSTVGECMKLPMTDITGALTLVPGFGDTSLVEKGIMDSIYKYVMDSAPNPENPGGGGGGGGDGGGSEDPPEEEDPNGENFVATPAGHQQVQLVGLHQMHEVHAHLI